LALACVVINICMQTVINMCYTRYHVCMDLYEFTRLALILSRVITCRRRSSVE